MSEKKINSAPETGGGPSGGDDEPIPFMQRFLDNHFLLLALGVAIPSVLYVIWGIAEIISIPMAQ
ncbi:MAG: hypothetical protein IMF08_13450 [Proteobacteria bacterium]|nr:hypothetical protein [Pseudomonadota bacterium]